MKTIDKKAEYFQRVLVNKYHEFFPSKTYKFSQDDKPWFSTKLKGLERKKKREYQKNHKSQKYCDLKNEYDDCLKKEKAKYYKNIVMDLKSLTQKSGIAS